MQHLINLGNKVANMHINEQILIDSLQIYRKFSLRLQAHHDRYFIVAWQNLDTCPQSKVITIYKYCYNERSLTLYAMNHYKYAFQRYLNTTTFPVPYAEMRVIESNDMYLLKRKYDSMRGMIIKELQSQGLDFIQSYFEVVNMV